MLGKTAMTCRAILAGSVAKPPVAKTGKSGKPFAILSVRETGVEPARWWSVILFGDGVQDVLRLNVGDPVALAGNVEAEVYTPEGGEARVSWKFTADAVLTARKAAKREAQP
jgi:Single-strand binding protein family